MFDLLRRGDTLIVRWVDRLGRNYDDVVDTIQRFMKKGVVIKTVINGFTFDGSTNDPMQKAVRDALIGFMAAMAQAEGTKDALRAGIAHAKANDSTAYRGRKPTFNREQLNTVLALAGQGAMNTSQIAKAVSLQRMAEARIKQTRLALSDSLPRGSYRTHMPRHACVFALANKGHDTRALQAYLGHKNIQHTVRYTELSPTRFKDFG